MVIERSDIEAAGRRIGPFVRETPALKVGDPFEGGYELWLKLEHTQVTGSFKPRGAFSFLTAVEIPEAGIAAASGGNFGIAAAYAASTLGHPATIFVPETSPPEKIDRISEHGADVRIISGFYDEALAAAHEFIAASGAVEAHAYDHPLIMAGQGTLGMELSVQVDPDEVLVAVGGGGLIGGIASWFQEDAKVIAVEPERCQSFHASIQAGRQVEVEVGGVAASSLGARTIGDNPWAVRHRIDSALLVGDDDIVAAQRWLWRGVRMAVEPPAATTVAVLRTGVWVPAAGSRVVAVLSGGNVDPATVV